MSKKQRAKRQPRRGQTTTFSYGHAHHHESKKRMHPYLLSTLIVLAAVVVAAAATLGILYLTKDIQSSNFAF